MTSFKTVLAMTLFYVASGFANSSDSIICKSLLWDKEAGIAGSTESLNVVQELKGSSASIHREIDGVKYDLEIEKNKMYLVVSSLLGGEAANYQCNGCDLQHQSALLQLKVKGVTTNPKVDMIALSCSQSR